MVRAAFVDKDGLTKGEWSDEEDQKLRAYVQTHVHFNWRLVPKYAGLNRCGKSCRLRWVNYLQPNVKRGNYTKQERDLIKRLHDEYGNKWSKIAKSLPGRTDNEIKNYWHTHFNKERRRTSNKKSGNKNQTKIVQEKSSESSITEHWVNFSNSPEISYPNSSSLMSQGNSEMESSDVYIFDSSSSSCSNSGVSVHHHAAEVDLDFESIADQELSGIQTQPWDPLTAAGSISGFQESSAKDAFEETDSVFDYYGFYLNEFFWSEDYNDVKLF